MLPGGRHLILRVSFWYLLSKLQPDYLTSSRVLLVFKNVIVTAKKKKPKNPGGLQDDPDMWECSILNVEKFRTESFGPAPKFTAS